MPCALLALGSNLGDRQQTCKLAMEKLAECSTAAGFRCSDLISSAPIGGPAGQGEFLNGAVVVDTTLRPGELLNQCRVIERAAGRERKVRWSARTLDLDLLLYEQSVSVSPDLEIPHPRMTYRRFVMEPAKQVAADWIHPRIQLPLAQLWNRLTQPGGACAIVGEIASDRHRLVDWIGSATMAFEIAEDQVAVDAAWPRQETTWLQIGTAVPDQSRLPPKLTLLLLSDRSPISSSQLSEAVIASDARGPMLFLPNAPSPEQMKTEVLAAIEAVWPLAYRGER